MEFELKRIGDLCSSTCSGGTPKSSEPAFYDGGTIPWLTTGEVDFKDIYDTENKITKLGLKKSSAKYIPVNSVIVAMYGVTAGKSAVNKIPLTTNQACCNLQINEKIANYRYVYYYLMMQSDQLNKLANGGAQQNLNSIIIKKFKISLPSIKNQEKIANVLHNYDLLIENNNQRIKKLEELAEAIYKEWFVRFRFPGFEKQSFKDGKPEKWQYKKFSEVCSFVRGVSYSSEQIEDPEAPFLLINLKNLRDYGGFRKDNFKKYDGDFKDEQTVRKFDLVMAVTEMVQERRIIGYVGLVPSYNQRCVISADLIKLKSKYNNIFLYSHFIFGGASLCFSQYGNGTNVIHLKPTSLRNVKLLIPEQKYIDEYVSIVSKYFDLIDKLEQKNENLIKQRDSLLPRLMSGKLSVEGKEIV